MGYINNSSPHAQFLSTHRSVRLHSSLTCMENRTGFCIDLFAFTIHSPAWETTPISASICSPSIRSPAWNRTDFCTSDHLGITHGRKTVSPLRNPCESNPFWSQLTIDIRLHENQFLYARSRMKRHLSLFFLSTVERRLTADHLDKILCTRLRSSMEDLSLSSISTGEHRITGAILERHHARVTSELFWSEVFTSVFLNIFVWFHMVCTKL